MLADHPFEFRYARAALGTAVQDGLQSRQHIDTAAVRGEPILDGLFADADAIADRAAARLVRRTNAKTPLPREKADALRQALAGIARRSFIKQDITFDEAQKLGIEAAQRLLDESQVRAFTEAMEGGLRALPDER